MATQNKAHSFDGKDHWWEQQCYFKLQNQVAQFKPVQLINVEIIQCFQLIPHYNHPKEQEQSFDGKQGDSIINDYSYLNRTMRMHSNKEFLYLND